MLTSGTQRVSIVVETKGDGRSLPRANNQKFVGSGRSNAAGLKGSKISIWPTDRDSKADAAAGRRSPATECRLVEGAETARERES